MTLRVAVAQFAASEDGTANTAAALAALARAGAAGARLTVLPEYAVAWAPRIEPRLADYHAEFEAALARAAAEHDMWVVAGTLRRHGDRLRNVAIVLGPDGAERAAYTKVHLFDAFGVRESETLEPGHAGAGVVVEIDGWQVGLATCYDLRFPETFRLLADGGAQVFAVGAAWASGPGKAEQLEVLARARALENTSYLLLASQVGSGRSGHSMIVGPLAEPLAAAGTEPDVLVTDLDLGRVEQVRSAVPSLAHRRYAVVPRD